MCAEGIALGREWQPSAQLLTVSSGGIIDIAPAAANRVRLMVSVAFASNVTLGEYVWVGPRTSTFLNGVVMIPPYAPTAILKIEDWGPLLLGPWSLYGAVVLGCPSIITDVRYTGLIPPYRPKV